MIKASKQARVYIIHLLYIPKSHAEDSLLKAMGMQGPKMIKHTIFISIK